MNDYDYIRQQAELMGLQLIDNDVVVIRKKWKDDPRCTVNDLLSAIRWLRDSSIKRGTWHAASIGRTH